ncbi:MAG TPA: LysE family translocator [Sphingorhabdus lacus]|jgi:threonine/homoserine/homoserine lactone efflux protein|nr:LysE family translocator [Sphingorhabdus lacus]
MVTALYVPFLITALLIELTPGPNMAWLALTSASKGRKSGFAAVAGIALGLALLGGASAFGLSELATGSPVVFNLLRYAGVAYLLWLAWETWSSGNEATETALDHSGLMDWFRHGLLLNLLNPKAAVFFITVLPAYISAGVPVASQTLLLSFSYVGIATAIHLVIVVLAGSAHAWLAQGGRQLLIRRIFAVMIALVAIWFLRSTA